MKKRYLAAALLLVLMLTGCAPKSDQTKVKNAEISGAILYTLEGDRLQYDVFCHGKVTGAVITETVFAWPGIGVYFTTAIRNLDYPVVMAVLVLSGSLVILGNLISDILCATIDPRIRAGR